MSNSFFFLQVDKNNANSKFLDNLELFSDEKKQQIYVINKPLGDSKYTYDYSNGIVLLIPNYKIIFVDFGNADNEFEEYVEDFIEDLGSISDKFRYKNIIGRPKSWKDSLIVKIPYDNSIDINIFLSEHSITEDGDKKKCELLISLLTGSINDIGKIKRDIPNNILDKVKQKIILFDGDQTRFVYQKINKKTITIQGLSGTGKTELLLHKLKDIYIENKESRVIFTCHNKILADNLKNRIPEFFNFMKVEEQIEWNKRLWCVNAWGSRSNKNSGAYSYICDFYNLQFYQYSYSTDFDYVCKIALDEIKKQDLNNCRYAFDFMLVDESQDFPKSFFELCAKVTKNTVYIAGDIFQSIFDSTVISEIQPDFLLSKCYRTDPKTLMFAHALGMGLFESPKLRWLDDKEWKACGYLVKKEGSNKKYILSREPLRRFEDLTNEGFDSIELVKTNYQKNGEEAETKIIEIIKSIRSENPTVLVDDIGIIFIDNTKNTYLSADKLEQSIPREFGWEVNKAYESKEKIKNTLFISNKNNVKGLEFPFVICVSKKITNARNYRNALYMMITRSFIKTYLLISEDSNLDLISNIEEGLNSINTNNNIQVLVPSDKEMENIRTTITYDEENISDYDFVSKVFDELHIFPQYREKLFSTVKNTVPDIFDKDLVKKVAEMNYKVMCR